MQAAIKDLLVKEQLIRTIQYFVCDRGVVEKLLSQLVVEERNGSRRRLYDIAT